VVPTVQRKDLPMKLASTTLHPIPGSDLVGRGVSIRPNAPYVPRRLLSVPESWAEYTPNVGTRSYLLPGGQAVDESPPVPTRQALNLVLIEESFDRFETHFQLDAKLAAGTMAFSIDANLGQTQQIRSDDNVYYALRSSFIPLWSVYLPTPPMLDPGVWEGLPDDFSFDHRQTYQDFFDTHGTHYVQRTWVGGQAKLVLTVLKSSDLSKQDIQSGISASLGTFASAGKTAEFKDTRSRLRNNSNCTVWGKGGAEYELAALSDLDEERYNTWLRSIRDNPMTIELEVKGIWTLVRDPAKRAALMTAYEKETSAPHVTSGFILSEPATEDPADEGAHLKSVAYIVQQDQFICYDFSTEETTKPKRVADRWPALKDPALNFGWVDASFQVGESLYMFSRTRYAALTLDGRLHTDNPTRVGDIASDWSGLPFERIDAAFSPNLDDVYFFSGDQYARYNLVEDRVAEGYPQTIQQRWIGVTFDRIDAVIYRPDTNKVYFFRGNQHIRYDMSIYRADPGYPKTIESTYVQDWRL
jgi:hypothetical protein